VAPPEGGGAAEVRWDEGAWPIDDWNPYNDVPMLRAVGSGAHRYPVPDVRVRAVVRPADAGAMTLTAEISASGHEFRAALTSGRVEIRGRMAVSGAEWETVAAKNVRVFRQGRSASVEFCNADQRLSVWVDGREVVSAEYEWGPRERTLYATGEEIGPAGIPAGRIDLLGARTYRRTGVRWLVEGSAAEMSRVGLDRDLYYQPTRRPARGVYPDTTMRLSGSQFFVLGDNSPASKDSRLWDHVDPWVAEELDETMGVVPRDLMMGKAFFVYFPAPLAGPRGAPVPDIGRMRLIR
jgi:hypothetical protein